MIYRLNYGWTSIGFTSGKQVWTVYYAAKANGRDCVVEVYMNGSWKRCWENGVTMRGTWQQTLIGLSIAIVLVTLAILIACYGG